MIYIIYLDDVIFLFVSNGDDDFICIDIDLGFKGLGGGLGWVFFCLLRGDESFFLKGGLEFFVKGMFLLKGDFFLDLDFWCVGRGGVGGFIFVLVCLGVGGIGGVCWFVVLGGWFLILGGDGLVEVVFGLLNFGLVGNGGSGILILNCFFWLIEEYCIGGIGGGELDWLVFVLLGLEREEYKSV